MNPIPVDEAVGVVPGDGNAEPTDREVTNAIAEPPPKLQIDDNAITRIHGGHLFGCRPCPGPT